MNLGLARASLTDAPEAARQAIAEAHEEAMLALTELRELVRGLHPAVLNDRGLDAALSGLAARAPLPVRLQVDLPPPGSAEHRGDRLLRRLRGADQRGQARPGDPAPRSTVTRPGDRLRIVVTDDGAGGAAIPPPGAAPGGRIRDRPARAGPAGRLRSTAR